MLSKIWPVYLILLLLTSPAQALDISGYYEGQVTGWKFGDRSCLETIGAEVVNVLGRRAPAAGRGEESAAGQRHDGQAERQQDGSHVLHSQRWSGPSGGSASIQPADASGWAS